MFTKNSLVITLLCFQFQRMIKMKNNSHVGKRLYGFLSDSRNASFLSI